MIAIFGPLVELLKVLAEKLLLTPSEKALDLHLKTNKKVKEFLKRSNANQRKRLQR